MLKKKLTLLLLLILTTIVVDFHHGLAQEDKLIVVYEGDFLSYIYWENRRDALIFAPLLESAWKQYTVDDRQIREIQGLPMRYDLTEDKVEQLNLLRIQDGSTKDAAFFVSPDGRYVIYPRRLEANVWNMSIADLQSGQTSDIQGWVWEVFNPSELYHVLWSKDRPSALVYSRISIDFGHTVFHISNITQNLKQSLSKELKVIDLATSSPSQSFAIWQPYALSKDGSIVLAQVADTSTNKRYLMLWNTKNLSQSRLIDATNGDRVLGATFTPNNESKLLIVNDMGLVEYDIISDEIVVVNHQVGAQWASHELGSSQRDIYRQSQALFSPNGQWVAIHLKHPEVGSKLYVLPTGRQ